MRGRTHNQDAKLEWGSGTASAASAHGMSQKRLLDVGTVAGKQRPQWRTENTVAVNMVVALWEAKHIKVPHRVSSQAH